MKIWKKSMLIFGAAIFLIISSMSVNAISDGTGDIWHWVSTEGGFVWQAYTGTNDKIDITNLDYSIEGSEVTMTMTVAAPIEDADTIYYLMHLLMGDDFYMATYLNGNGLVIGSGSTLGGFMEQLTDPVSGNTFTATFTVDDPSADYEIRGYAQEFSTYGDETGAEWWGDWAPDTYFNEYTGYQGPDGDGDDDDDVTCWQCNENNESVSQTFPAGTVCGEGDAEEYPYNTQPTCGSDGGGGTGGTSGTPGFETLTLLAAIAIALIILRKRR